MSDEAVPRPAPPTDCWAPANDQSPGAIENQASGTGATSGRNERYASFGALLSAFIASSWCWLPPLLILGGISGAGMTALLEDFRPIFIVVTFAFLGLAFYLSYRPRPAAAGDDGAAGAAAAAASGRSTIMTFNRVMLWAVTVVAVLFLFFPQAVTNLFASGDEITADMQQTVIEIEGMTWHTWAPKAAQALKSVPGVLAVKVDYDAGTAIIGTQPGQPVPADQLLRALRSIRYRGVIKN